MALMMWLYRILAKMWRTLSRMAYQPDKLNFISADKVDKIFEKSSIATPLTYAVGASSSSTQTIAHTLGQKCFMTLAFSTDGTNYYMMQNRRVTSGGVFTYTANGWADSTNAYIFMQNSTASPVTFYIKYVLDTLT